MRSKYYHYNDYADHSCRRLKMQSPDIVYYKAKLLYNLKALFTTFERNCMKVIILTNTRLVHAQQSTHVLRLFEIMKLQGSVFSMIATTCYSFMMTK